MNIVECWPARAEGQTPDKTGRPDEPWWTRDAIRWMDGFLKPHMSVLEWGSGASTLWMARRIKSLVTIEHDQEWAKRVRANDANQPDNYCITILPLDFTYFDWTRGTRSQFDAVIVDGRLRVFCCEAGARVLKSGGVLLFDNAQEEKYAEAHELLKDWPVIHTDNGIWRTDIFTKP